MANFNFLAGRLEEARHILSLLEGANNAPEADTEYNPEGGPETNTDIGSESNPEASSP